MSTENEAPIKVIVELHKGFLEELGWARAQQVIDLVVGETPSK